MRGLRNSVLDRKHSAFIVQGLSILVASRDTGNHPVLCRACGCRVRADDRVDVFLNAGRARQVLDSVSASRAVAAVFSEPPTHRTIQLKGDDAEVGPFDDSLQPLLDAYADAFSVTLEALGYSAVMAREMVRSEGSEVKVVTFTPTKIFDQTPGPRAGEPMGTR